MKGEKERGREGRKAEEEGREGINYMYMHIYVLYLFLALFS